MMRLHDPGKIFGGLALFLALLLAPLWYNRVTGAAAPAPDPAPAKARSRELFGSELCVRPTDEMRKEHPALLHEWRDRVVREGVREYITRDGRRVAMSLTQGCLGCHSNKTEFCDRCHAAAAVKPDCFECHVGPKGGP